MHKGRFEPCRVQVWANFRSTQLEKVEFPLKQLEFDWV